MPKRKKKKISQEEFLEKVASKHGNKYDVSNVIYTRAKDYIYPVCKKHGPFRVRTNHFLEGAGCKKCADEAKSLGREVFIEKAKQIHGDLYDYSLVDYKNNSTMITIICKKHGEFMQYPANHLKGGMCPSCTNERFSRDYTFSNEEFIQRAKSVHGDTYDYSKTVYKKARESVTIACRTHGDFNQIADGHLRGHGCPVCAGTQKKTNEQFIDDARKIHGDRYDYSKVNYVNSATPVEIICSIHGSFWQTPNVHLNVGSGCQKCAAIIRTEKSLESKRRNGTFHTSSKEDALSEKLSELYDIERNYNLDPRYPFACDFYIPERDLFIEYNGFYMHGVEWYHPLKKYSKQIVEKWKNSKTKQSSKAIKTYTESDVNKRKAAKANNLNYVVLWNWKDVEEWFALGCPDGHDGDGMYTWKNP